MSKLSAVAVMTVFCFANTPTAWSHCGGLGRYGCHHNRHAARQLFAPLVSQFHEDVFEALIFRPDALPHRKQGAGRLRVLSLLGDG